MENEAEANNKELMLFESTRVRREWHANRWFFSVIDVITALTGSTVPRRYWSDLKAKLKQEGSEAYDKIVQLKVPAEDAKKRSTDMADEETVFRLIQSIPSPKAEPFKLWLASLGKQRIDEIEDPELAMNRAKELYEKKGYPKSWIDKRLRGINIRHTLTDEWKGRGVIRSEYGILTDEIYKGAFEMTAKQYKDYKSLNREQNLRDHMNDVELILTMLGEASTTEITRSRDSKEFHELDRDAKDGGTVAGSARKNLESKVGHSVISDKKFLPNGKKEEK